MFLEGFLFRTANIQIQPQHRHTAGFVTEATSEAKQFVFEVHSILAQDSSTHLLDPPTNAIPSGAKLEFKSLETNS